MIPLSACHKPQDGNPHWERVVLQLPFDGADGSTTITDVSPAPLTCTAYADAQLDTALKPFGNSSLLLDGTGDYVGIASFPALGTGNFTIETFIYSTSYSELDGVLDFRPGGNGAYALLYTSGGILRFYVNTVDRIVSAALPTSAWNHIAVCRNKGVSTLFVNGAVSGTPWTDATNYLSAATAYIGKTFDNYYFAGNIGPVRVTTAALYTTAFDVPAAAFLTS